LFAGGKAVKNKYHKPSSDGCGSLGLKVRLVLTDQPPVVLFENLHAKKHIFII
jgi:hypothetical protein